jgi:hypothetical protein
MAPSAFRTSGVQRIFALTAFVLTFHTNAATFPLPIPIRPTTFPLARPNQIGEVVAWGDNSEGQTTVPPGLTNIVAIAAGVPNVALALRSDGTVVAWGDNRNGDCDVPSGLTNVVAISLAPASALRSDGTVVTWGTYAPPIPGNLNNIIGVFSGPLALRSDGTITTWGPGNLTIPVNATNVVAAVSVPGGTISIFLRGDGTIVNSGTQAGFIFPFEINGVASISGSPTCCVYSLAAVRTDGTVISQIPHYDTPVGLRATAVACGESHKVAILRDGTTMAWGDNSWGQTNLPPRLRGVIAVAAANSFSMALKLPTPPIPTAAVVSAQMVNGFIVRLDVIDGGEGYDVPPTVTITGGGGSGATATAQISRGIVTNLVVINAGFGYTSQPTITVTPPTFLPKLSIAPSRVNVVLQVVPGKRYQLESSDDLPNFSAIGAPFMATANTVTNEFTLSETGKFFRIQEVP